MQCFVCKSKSRRRKRAVRVLCIWTNGVRRPFFAGSDSDNHAGDAGFEQEALKALEKLDAVQPIVPTTGDAARDETADV